jgi:hypothetical protein
VRQGLAVEISGYGLGIDDLIFFSIASLFSAHCKMAREIFCAKRD